MKKTAICLLLAISFTATAQIFTFKNKALGVSFSTETGAFTVLDKRTDRVYKQPDKLLHNTPPSITVTRSPNELTTIDVDYTMTGHAKDITDDADCSFITQFDWNDQYLIMQIAVRDDVSQLGHVLGGDETSGKNYGSQSENNFFHNAKGFKLIQVEQRQK